MAKTKQVKKEDHFPDVNKKVEHHVIGFEKMIMSNYKPLPRFGSGCKYC